MGQIRSGVISEIRFAPKNTVRAIGSYGGEAMLILGVSHYTYTSFAFLVSIRHTPPAYALMRFEQSSMCGRGKNGGIFAIFRSE